MAKRDRGPIADAISFPVLQPCVESSPARIQISIRSRRVVPIGRRVRVDRKHDRQIVFPDGPEQHAFRSDEVSHVANVLDLSTSERRDHWVGANKLGTDSEPAAAVALTTMGGASSPVWRNWQRIRLVIGRLGVRVPPPAPSNVKASHEMRRLRFESAVGVAG
jgi:hypothetical protein